MFLSDYQKYNNVLLQIHYIDASQGGGSGAPAADGGGWQQAAGELSGGDSEKRGAQLVISLVPNVVCCGPPP